MKKFLRFKRFLSVVLFALFSTFLASAATQYCGSTLTNGTNSIQLTCEKVSGDYTMTIEGSNLNGLGGSFFNPGATDLRTKITSSTSTKIVINFGALSSEPQLYTPLYVLMPGEVNFGNINIDWSATCTPVTDPTLTVSPASLSFTAQGDETFQVTGGNLTTDITVSSDNANFTVSPAVISKDAAFPVDVTVTCNATAAANANITIASTGAASQSVTASYSANTECAGTSSEASQMSFTTGYNYEFSTSGTTVTISFELLDAKDGVIAYLWNYTSGFSETGMAMSGKKGTISLTNQVKGSTLNIACKFAYAGGMAVTKQFIYHVGENCLPPAEDPEVSVSQVSLNFFEAGTKQVSVSAAHLTSDITITSDNANYTISPSSISKDATFPVDVNITSTGTASTGIISFASEGAETAEVSVTTTEPKEIIFTEESRIDGAGVFLYFNGYGTEYERVLSKYTAAVTSTQGNITSITVQNPTGSYLFCALSAAPGSDAITEVTITYENGDSGVATFKGTKFKPAGEPEMSIEYGSMIFTSTTEEKTITVNAENLSSAITITAPAGFSVSPASIAADATFPYEVTVSCNASENAQGNITFASEGVETQSAGVKYYVSGTCSGVWASFAGAPTQDCSFVYNYYQTASGQVVMEFTFLNTIAGINPQLQFDGKAGYRNMISQGNNKYTYTTTSADFDGDSFTFNGYFAYAGGLAQTTNITYTLGDCPTANVKIGDNTYATLGDAIADCQAGQTILVLADVSSESNTVASHVKINGGNFNIGDITIATGGKLEFETNGASIGNLIIKSQANAGSGQIVLNGNTVTPTNVYFDRQFCAGDPGQNWYSVAVPFTVNVDGGVLTTSGESAQSNVMFNSYNGANRAEYGPVKQDATGYAWEIPTTLEAGKAYMLYSLAGLNTLRFKAASASTALNAASSIDYTFYDGSGEATDKGWNFLAQPMLQNAIAGITAGNWGYIQVLHNGGNDSGDDGGKSAYSTEWAPDVVIAPFTAFMFQASASGTMNFTGNAGDATIKSAETSANRYYKVELVDGSGNKDWTFVSASESAKADEYEIGKDLTKCGSTSTGLQICTEDFGLTLTVNEAKAVNGTAVIPLLLNAPKAGNYTINLAEAAEIGDIYLMKNGSVIADLADDAYTVALSKGLNKDYALQIVLSDDITTKASEAEAGDSVYVSGGVIYVNGVPSNEIFNLIGQQVQYPLPSGVYLVKTNSGVIKINY